MPKQVQVIDYQVRIVTTGDNVTAEVTPLWETGEKADFKVEKVEKNSLSLSWKLKNVKRNK